MPKIFQYNSRSEKIWLIFLMKFLIWDEIFNNYYRFHKSYDWLFQETGMVQEKASAFLDDSASRREREPAQRGIFWYTGTRAKQQWRQQSYWKWFHCVGFKSTPSFGSNCTSLVIAWPAYIF